MGSDARKGTVNGLDEENFDDVQQLPTLIGDVPATLQSHSAGAPAEIHTCKKDFAMSWEALRNATNRDLAEVLI